MAIDDCEHSFSDLTKTVLPAHFARLEEAMKHPWEASKFSEPRLGPASLAKGLELASDFSGCYVLLEGETAVYVGISRKVLQRLRQHMLGKDHFAASLAYAMAKKGHALTLGTRKKAMEDVDFADAFKASQEYLRGLSVAVVAIENPLELYVFEAYAALELKTADWNTFRTH